VFIFYFCKNGNRRKKGRKVKVMVARFPRGVPDDDDGQMIHEPIWDSISFCPFCFFYIIARSKFDEQTQVNQSGLTIID
jgi:hypothetical protein